MAFSVAKIDSIVAYITTAYDADDGSQDVDNTTCMTNGTLAEDCDEIKLGVLCLRIGIDVPPSSINSLSIRVYLNSIMSAGDNAILPYIDANSVSITNENVQAYNSAPGWVTHILSANFLAQLADVGGKTYLRFGSGESGSNGVAKSKIGEIEIDISYDTYKYEGITKDNAGDVLGSCYVALFQNLGGTPPTYQFMASTTSDSSTGAYIFTGQGNFNAMVYSIKLDSPHVFDATDNVITGVME